MYTIEVNLPDGYFNYCDLLVKIRVNFTGEEFAKLDKVIMNQIYAESKPKVQAAMVFQHAAVIWGTHTPDDVTMRTLGAWAITQYRSNGSERQVSLTVSALVGGLAGLTIGAATHQRGGVLLGTLAGCLAYRFLPCRYKNVRLILNDKAAASKPTSPKDGILPEKGDSPNDGTLPKGGNPQPPKPPPKPPGTLPSGKEGRVPRNDLGYVLPGHGNEDTHPLGGTDDADSELRTQRQDRIIVKEAGVGVIGQSREPTNSKQVVGVIGLPVSEPPNVYAKEAANIDSAIDNRITKKQRPFTANKDDKVLIGQMVADAIGNHPQKSLFSARRVAKWWETHLFQDLKSGKWTANRLQNTVENLCGRIQPGFKLSCDVKLEPMPEGKAPRMLIADGDEGQVLALLTICCIEDLIKKHLPKKTIKGLGKREAMERMAAELRIPKAAYSKTQTKGAKPSASVFEGDGSAWDTTCSDKLRDCVENPVIMHVASVLKVLMVQPQSWVDAHGEISAQKQLIMTFKKNAEFEKYTIDAI